MPSLKRNAATDGGALMSAGDTAPVLVGTFLGTVLDENPYMGRLSAEQRREREERAEDREWRRFFLYLKHISHFKDACDFANSGPRQSEPGGLLYTHLGYFLHTFTVCDGVVATERQAYLELSRRMDAAGELAPGVLARLEKALAG